MRQERTRGGLGLAIGAWVLTVISGLQFVGSLAVENSQPFQIENFFSVRGFVGNVAEIVGLTFIALAAIASGLFSWFFGRSRLGVVAVCLAAITAVALVVRQFFESAPLAV